MIHITDTGQNPKAGVGRHLYGGELEAFAPPGQVWSANDCHSIIEHYDNLRGVARARAELQALMELGTRPCEDRPHCDLCDEPDEKA